MLNQTEQNKCQKSSGNLQCFYCSHKSFIVSFGYVHFLLYFLLSSCSHQPLICWSFNFCLTVSWINSIRTQVQLTQEETSQILASFIFQRDLVILSATYAVKLDWVRIDIQWQGTFSTTDILLWYQCSGSETRLSTNRHPVTGNFYHDRHLALISVFWPMITLKQSLEILYCIRALIGSQCNDWRMGWTQ